MSQGRDAITLLVAMPLSQRALEMTEQPTVIIVDDDPGIREALGSLIRSVGVQAKALASVPEFLNEGRPDGPTCLVLGEVVSIFSASSRRPTFTFRSSSSPDMATSRCPSRR